jgi:short-subunit dehydrogenase
MTRSRIILVTGATSGIGRHAALHLARQGHRVFASGRSATALAEVLKEAHGTTLETLPLDVTDPRSVAEAKAAIDVRTNGYGVDVLVNNAGFGTVGPTELITDEDMRAQYEVNVFGLMAMIRAFVPEMRARGAGRVVNVSSLGGRYTFPFLGVYNSTKYAVESLSDALRIELAPFGVHVSLIEPGVIHTNFTDRSVAGAGPYRGADSPYAPVLERLDEMRKLSDKTAVGPECISRAIARAATARNPRARYVAPLRAGLAMAFLRGLPTRLADWMVRLAFGITRKRFARSLAANVALKQLPGPQA